MRVAACPYPDYGTLKGEVKAIAPDAVSSQKNDANTDKNSTPKATRGMGIIGTENRVKLKSLIA